MARKRILRVRIDLDKVERDLVAKVKLMKPEYADLDPYQVAKMELRYRLFSEIRKLKSVEQAPPQNSPVVWRSSLLEPATDGGMTA